MSEIPNTERQEDGRIVTKRSVGRVPVRDRPNAKPVPLYKSVDFKVLASVTESPVTIISTRHQFLSVHVHCSNLIAAQGDKPMFKLIIEGPTSRREEAAPIRAGMNVILQKGIIVQPMERLYVTSNVDGDIWGTIELRTGGAQAPEQPLLGSE